MLRFRCLSSDTQVPMLKFRYSSSDAQVQTSNAEVRSSALLKSLQDSYGSRIAGEAWNVKQALQMNSSEFHKEADAVYKLS